MRAISGYSSSPECSKRLATHWCVVIVIAFLLGAGSATASPPSFPANFDKQTLSSLISAADSGDNEAIIKFGYFLHRQFSIVSEQEGIAMLDARISGVAPNTRTWLVLEEIRGFGGLHGEPSEAQEGFDAYTQILNIQIPAVANASTDVVVRAIYDLTCSVKEGSALSTLGAVNVPQPLLVKAYASYLRLAALNAIPTRIAETIPWTTAISNSGSDGTDFEAVARSSSVLQTCSLEFSEALAAGYAVSDPNASIDILERAKPAVATASPEQAATYYRDIVQLLLSQTRNIEAIDTEKDCVKATGAGRPQLLLLLFTSQCNQKYESVLAAIKNSPNSDEEIVESASLLLSVQGVSRTASQQASADAIALLQGYLGNASRKSDTESLRARLLLADTLANNGNVGEAKNALAGAVKPTDVSNPQANMIYDAIERLNVRLSTGSSSLQEAK